MIFLTVGTWHRGYDRLVQAVDELVGNKIITEEVIAQTGYSAYVPQHLTVIGFCSPDEFVNIISTCCLVISHAGVGTMAEVIKQHKPIIVVPRKALLGEVDNDHQFATAKQLEKEGKILVAYKINELPAKLKEAETFVPVQGQGSKEILKVVQAFIDDLVTTKAG